MLGQPALAYEKNQWKTEFLFLVQFVYNPSILIKLGLSIFVLKIFLQAMVDLHFGVSLSLSLFTICPATCLSCPSLCHTNSDLTGQWAPGTSMIFRTFFHLKAHTKLNTLYPLQ